MTTPKDDTPPSEGGMSEVDAALAAFERFMEQFMSLGYDAHTDIDIIRAALQQREPPDDRLREAEKVIAEAINNLEIIKNSPLSRIYRMCEEALATLRAWEGKKE